ncbi:MAG: class I SAM-dependent methyltransferase [Woeseia sp.]|nr:class I SAM-dependent methyltransferase [Woeseia sp.]
MALQTAAARTLELTETGLLPDTLVRAGIRRLLKSRLKEIHADDVELSAAASSAFVEMMKQAEIAPLPDQANEQHYEVPAEFFAEALGEHRKYSCCFWQENNCSLEKAEADALRITCERAEIEDGMTVLDLGCGWGSLSLWIASRFPQCTIQAVSNSQSQHDYIVGEASRRGLQNLAVTVCDMNDYDAEGSFDRIVSVEMFEHMRNYERLFGRVARWLKPDGRFFMHIFCHRSTPYEFIDKGPQDWMTRFFFAGGIMPSDDLPLHFQKDLAICDRWRWSGRHYAQTSNAWLERMDARRHLIMPILKSTYGPAHAQTWFVRWRIFFMACAELFDFNNGEEWYVGHYLFKRQPISELDN